MKVLARIWAVVAMGALLAEQGAVGDTITTYSDSSSFTTAMGVPLYVEDFGNSTAYPITTGILNSQTNFTPKNGIHITPGTILPGVTYSTPIGTGNFFNIDEGLYFTGAFLDNSSPSTSGNSHSALTVTFDNAVKGFGFDTSEFFMGSSFQITFQFASGSSSTQTVAVMSNTPQFVGFISSATDIVSASLYGNNDFHSFGIDNFTYSQSAAAVPEPSSIVSGGLACLIGALGAWRVRRGRSRED